MARRSTKILGGTGGFVGLGARYGADPIASDETQLRAAILAKLPVGSPVGAVEEESERLVHTARGEGSACGRRDDASIRCLIPLTSSAFGIHRERLQVDFAIDATRRLADVTLRKTRWLLGRRL